MSTNSQRKSLVKEFQNITNATESVATEVLSKHSYDLEVALNDFFNNRNKYATEASKKTDDNKLHKLFATYAGQGDEKNYIADEGLARYFQDMKIDPSSASTLAVAWLLKCKGFGEIEEKEFTLGWKVIGADTLPKMQTEVQKLETSLQERKGLFREFYRWLFEFIKEDSERKSVEIDVAREMWSLVFSKDWIRPWTHLGKWLEFCEKKKYKVIAKDVWSQLHEFICDVKDDLSNYDADGAWPVMMDEFVDFLKSSSP